MEESTKIKYLMDKKASFKIELSSPSEKCVYPESEISTCPLRPHLGSRITGSFKFLLCFSLLSISLFYDSKHIKY